MHHYKDDYALMKNLGIKAYRFSLNWARILPEGTGRVNEKAIAMYRDMILTMKENGITPYITLFHWEFPQALQEKGGWLNEEVVDWFGEYAKVVAENFSDICEDFITINEPQCVVGLGHLSGVHAPGFPKTACNWSVTPKAFYYGIKFLTERYPLPLYITENGMSCHDNVSFDGRVHDNDRITFLDSYIGAMRRAYDEGADIRGYFLWTFLDNFEWSEGYRERFGMIYVDFMTQRRIVKDSAFWYQDVIKTNGGNLSMNQTTKEILFLDPVCTHNIWGGTRLREDFHYPVEGDDLGECWGISAHPNGDGTLRDCGFRGMKLSELWKKHPEVFGNVDSDRFPLMVKIIDAKDDLSIQVHPDDDYAKVHENGSLGKTECWYILDCKENATIVIGHNARTKEELSRMIHEGKWSEFIREIPIKKGDFLQIDPGTVHAIKGGTLILETQQNSDITYRVYDYDRLSDGKPRELHIDKSIDVITVPAKSVADSVKSVADLPVNTLNELYACKYYHIYKIDVSGKMTFEQNAPFMNMTVTEGNGIVNGQPVKKGDHFILPNGFGNVELQGSMQIIASTI
jgi:beta-glucosidase